MERRPPPVAAPATSRAFAPTSPDAAVAAARAAANAAKSIEALAEALARFDGCGLKATAKHLCFYRGAAKARLMIVGEAPGREDDLAGAPFSGPAGELLEKMLAAIGIAPDTCHITNAVYCVRQAIVIPRRRNSMSASRFSSGKPPWWRRTFCFCSARPPPGR